MSKHLNPTFMLNEPVSPEGAPPQRVTDDTGLVTRFPEGAFREAAPPRATTPEPCPNPHCKNGWIGNVGCSICKRALAPSRESGALAWDEQFAAACRAMPDGCSIISTRALSTLERDAALGRALLAAMATLPEGHELSLSNDGREGWIGPVCSEWKRHSRNDATRALRAALTPSGEPTTKGDSK